MPSVVEFARNRVTYLNGLNELRKSLNMQPFKVWTVDMVRKALDQAGFFHRAFQTVCMVYTPANFEYHLRWVKSGKALSGRFATQVRTFLEDEQSLAILTFVANKHESQSVEDSVKELLSFMVKGEDALSSPPASPARSHKAKTSRKSRKATVTYSDLYNPAPWDTPATIAEARAYLAIRDSAI